MTRPPTIEIDDVTHRFGSRTALENVSLTLRAGVITGLVGRNGAGKSTLCRLVAALIPAGHGTVRIGGEPVWENADALSRVCLMRDRGGVIEDERPRHTERLYRALRPQWDEELYRRLIDGFAVPTKRTPQKMSTGQRSAFLVALALASRAEVTILDEVYLGMDAVARRRFSDELMADYVAHPRTIVLSSHLLDEVEPLMEDVVILHEGRLVAVGDADEVRRTYSGEGELASLTDVLVTVSRGGSS
ncbi:ABC transporter ATP-binding protein [Mobilicoccus sp.]|uniref:ABC transporter ATP-binding protein n=1 Tax=Mobilicoccus sp. TaxID=2034349 RepID=UPI0028A1F27B|nr:ABC transporter ATP-binding protein [Mobilicoccus sp.]